MARCWAPRIAALRPAATIYCSGMLRSLQTTAPLVDALDTACQVHPQIHELQGLVPKGGDVHAPASVLRCPSRRLGADRL